MTDPAGKTRTAGEDTGSSPATKLGRRRIASNVASTLATNVVRRATMFLIYILVARSLGSNSFGQLALASTLLFSWQQIAMMGLQSLVAREVARDRQSAGTCLVHASVIGTVASLLGLAMIVPFVKVMRYGPDTVEVIYLIFLGLVPLVLSQTCEGILQGLERMDLTALVNVPLGLLKVAAVYAVIEAGSGIRGVALSLTVLQFAVMLLQWLVFARWVEVPHLAFRLASAVKMVRASSVFLGIQTTIAIKASVAVTILSKIGGESSVGVYVAATQLMAPFSLLFNSVAFALFPALCRGFERVPDQLRVMLQRAIEALMIIALPSVVGIFLRADAILMLLYDDADFLLSATVLRIVVWSLLAEALTSIVGQVLWASSRERKALRITVTTTVVHCLGCLILIRSFGVTGAAVSLLLTSVLNLLLHFLPIATLLPASRLLAAVKNPTIATASMACFVLFSPKLNLAATIVGAAAVYGAVLAGMLIATAGGISQFKKQLAQPWSI